MVTLRDEEMEREEERRKREPQREAKVGVMGYGSRSIKICEFLDWQRVDKQRS